MSVIIRLQNLPWSANALDIRQFFRGLSIPEGGVHIVGGELGDAFIAFSTDEDARQAFQLNNGKIKEIQIKLLLSSRTEMQKVIEAARTAPFMQSVVPPQAIPTPALIPQAPIITASAPILPISDIVKKDDKDKSTKDDPKRRSRDRDRERSRRRSRSRSRSRDRKDRSRDRRRRRDRSRSRDRRDRRDRRRRTRSRDRTRSKDRESRGDSRKSRDDNNKKESNKSSDVIEIKDEGPTPRVWEQKEEPEVKPPPVGLLGNYPGGPSLTTLEDARRSLGLLAGLQQNNVPGNNMMNNMNNRMSRNDMNNQGGNENNWQRKSRFDNPEMGMNQFNHGNMSIRPSMGQMGANMGQNMGSNIFPNQSGIRLPMSNLQEGFGMNRPFLARPGTTFPNQFDRPDQRNQHNQQKFGNNNDRSDESFRKDRNKMNNCVQLRPYFGGYGEVRKFFHGLYISNTGVKFVAENGKRTGIVYIKFVRPDGKEQALSRSGMMLKGVPVDIAHLDDEEWDHYGEDDLPKGEDNKDNRKEERIDSPHVQHFTCVVVDDLPEFAKEHDILKIFSGYTIVSVHMVVNKQYRQQAYVQFTKEEDAKNAISDKTSHVISGKPVTVRPISDDTFNEVIRQQGNGEMVIDGNNYNDDNSPVPDNFPPKPHIITDCVVLNGLPQKTTDRDVLDFFSDIGIVPLRIHIMMNKFGPTGECFCEFNNPDEAVCALDKNEMPLGTGTVHVELCHRRDMERALGGPPSSQGPMNPGPRFQGRFGPRLPTLLGPGPGPGLGGPGPGLGGPGPRPPNMLRRRPPGSGMRYDGPFDSMGPQGCVVSMENVPFKAGVDEILEFFGNFELANHNVFRRFNENGAPTGDARVTFNNPTEAHRAVEECNTLKIRDRTIFLRLL